MELTNIYPAIGGGVGFILWVVMLESNKMSGVIFRKNDEGEKIFTPQNIWSFFCAPFKHVYFWTSELIIHNWIVITAIGMFIGYFIAVLVNSKKN